MLSKEQSSTPSRDSRWIRFKKALYARIAYNIFAVVQGKVDDKLKLLNLGLVEQPNDAPILKPEDENERLQFQLYDRILRRLDIKNKSVLEIGCGVGGGCYYIDEYYKAAEVVGIDLINRHIELADQYFGDRNILFQIGDASNYTFPKSSFDVVVNLESSHLYTDFQKFVELTFQVLKPGGYFTFADIRIAGEFQHLEHIFRQHGFECVHQEDFSLDVVKALDHDESRKDLIFKNIPFGKTLFRNFSFVQGSAYYEALRTGKWIFKHYLLHKPVHD